MAASLPKRKMPHLALIFLPQPSRFVPLLCLLLLIGAAGTATAQSQINQETRLRRVNVSERGGILRLENDLEIAQSESLAKSPAAIFAEPSSLRFKQLLTEQINHRLGAPYVYGAAGPWYFDCSGFVWSVFQAAGVSFERTSARSLWEEFAPVKGGEEYKFGTLVFFNNLRHVGIVVDQTGFYHASRSNGVTYSPFNEYWTNRVDGFRRIPESFLIAAE